MKNADKKPRTMHGWTFSTNGWESTWTAPDGSRIQMFRNAMWGDRPDGWVAYDSNGHRIEHLYDSAVSITRSNPNGFGKKVA